MGYRIKIILLLFQNCCITKNNLKEDVKETSYNKWPYEGSVKNWKIVFIWDLLSA